MKDSNRLFREAEAAIYRRRADKAYRVACESGKMYLFTVARIAKEQADKLERELGK